MADAAGQEAVRDGVLSLRRRVGGNFFWSLVSEALTKGIFFFTTIYLARRLGVANFGLFAVAQTITYYFWLGVDLGVNMYGIREIAKNKDAPQQIAGPLLGLRVTMGVVIYAILASFVYFSGFAHDKKLVVLGCGLYLVTYSPYMDWVCKGLEKFRYIAAGSFISSSLFLTGTLLFVKSDADATTAALVWSSSYAFGSASLYFMLRRHGVRIFPVFGLGNWISHIRESYVLTVAAGLMILYQYMPILLLGAFFTTYEVGLFAAPYRIIVMLCSAGVLIPMSFYPVFSETYVKDRARFISLYRKFQKGMVAAGLSAGVIGFLFSGVIVRLLLGPKYEGSVPIFRVLAWMVSFFFIKSTYGSILTATGYQRWYPIAGAIALVSGFCFCYVLMRYDPTTGVAMGIVAGEAVVVVTMMVISKFTFLKGAPA